MLKLFALLAGLLAASVALAQTQPLPEPNDAARVLVAAPWELSNPDRDRRCQVTFRLDPAPPGRTLALAPACGVAFPDLRPAAAWILGRDDLLRILDAKGTVLLELSEVENGMYETSPSYTHYFLQTLAAVGKERITDDLFGDWQFMRSGKAICQLNLGNTAYDADSFALTLKPGCDQLVTRFAPVAWRFEENDENAWSRIPAMRPPLTMVRPQQPAQ